MAYRYEKNLNGEKDLVIDGFEKGIADSPFDGIGNIRNMNVKYYKGVAYVNYKRQSVTMSTFGNFTVTIASPAVFTYNSHNLVAGNQVIFTTTGTLPTGLTVNTGYFIISTTTNTFQVSATPGGSAVNTSGSQSGTHSIALGMGNPKYSCQSPAGLIYISDDQKHIFKQSAVNSSTFGQLIGSTAQVTGNFPQNIGGISFWNNYLIVIGSGSGGSIEICGDGSGDAGVNSANWNTSTASTGVWPIKNSSTITLTGTPMAGDTSATISGYTDAQGTSRAFWNGPTGFYNMEFSGTNQIVLASLTQGSTAVTWTPALNTAANSATVIAFFNGGQFGSTGVEHMSLIAVNTGDLYFCNGSNIGAFTLNPNQVFAKGDMNTFIFYSNILSLPPTETSIWLSELKNQLIIAGVQKLYPWDFFSSFWTNPIPMDEKIIKLINILNNLYIFAGNKGNIYISNGYSIERYKKMPDSIAGVIDPAWNVGGLMQHRQKPYFQMLATNSQTGTAIMAGIFSIDLDEKALNMENQNSAGLTPTGVVFNGLLIDDNSTAINYDKYYSAFGASASTIDFNDTTLYSSNEAVIESDLIPIGTFFQNRTFASAEFKLDQPMQSGDSITLYARQSLSDSYTLIGSTATLVLSNGFPSLPFQSWQWIQFKATISCNPTATSSSFVPLREIRIR